MVLFHGIAPHRHDKLKTCEFGRDSGSLRFLPTRHPAVRSVRSFDSGNGLISSYCSRQSGWLQTRGGRHGQEFRVFADKRPQPPRAVPRVVGSTSALPLDHSTRLRKLSHLASSSGVLRLNPVPASNPEESTRRAETELPAAALPSRWMCQRTRVVKWKLRAAKAESTLSMPTSAGVRQAVLLAQRSRPN